MRSSLANHWFKWMKQEPTGAAARTGPGCNLLAPGHGRALNPSPARPTAAVKRHHRFQPCYRWMANGKTG
jgi:hypothetical protein